MTVRTCFPFTIVYITSRGHSGSTLLDLLLSSHTEIAGVGECKMLARRTLPSDRRPIEKACMCGADSSRNCPFWERVDAEMMRSEGLSLWETDPCSDNTEEFRLHNEALFRAVSAVSGCRFVVDSSKSLDRLRALLDAAVFDVRPIHLIRSPYGVVHSNIKRGRDWLYHSANYTQAEIRTRRTLSGRDHYTVRYEAMARSPRETIADLMRWLGLSFEDGQMNWSAHEHHNIGGNAMRFSGNSEVKEDTGWKQGLSLSQRTGIACLTFPTRLHGSGFCGTCRSPRPLEQLRRWIKKRARARTGRP